MGSPALTPHTTRPKRRLGRWLAQCLGLLLLFGFVAESAFQSADLRRFPPHGKLVDMGGYFLHLHCTGQGSPTVLLEGGLGGGVVTWPYVQPEVAKVTRVCSYDRSGWAWSGGTPPPDGTEAVTRLHTVLERAGEKGPYVLVGHSLGGLYNQLFAAAYPDEVAGLVLVDARHQEFALRLPPQEQGGSSFIGRVVAPVLTRVGVVRLLGNLGAIPGIPGGLPPGMMEMAIRPASQRAAAGEAATISATEAAVRAAPVNLGDKPVLVLTRDPATDRSAPGLIWHETQQLYLGLSANSRLVVARRSGHMIPYNDPELVARVLTEAVAAAR